MTLPKRRSLRALLFSPWLFTALPGPAIAQGPRVGIVVMHGAGARGTSMADFAARLKAQGHLVANLDMPWSNEDAHAVPVAAAERQVLGAVDSLRRQGAQKLVLAGFSKGGMFAGYMATRTVVDGLVALAPNGGADQKKLQDELAKARALIAAGKGEERALLHDADVVGETRYPIPNAVPSAYVTWFDPQGALNFERIFRGQRPGMPVLLVVPTRDLANLVKIKQPLFQGLPPHPGHRLFEPETDHLGAVRLSTDEVLRWIAEVVQETVPR